jgi:hypothetical protein
MFAASAVAKSIAAMSALLGPALIANERVVDAFFITEKVGAYAMRSNSTPCVAPSSSRRCLLRLFPSMIEDSSTRRKDLIITNLSLSSTFELFCRPDRIARLTLPSVPPVSLTLEGKRPPKIPTENLTLDIWSYTKKVLVAEGVAVKEGFADDDPVAEGVEL